MITYIMHFGEERWTLIILISMEVVFTSMEFCTRHVDFNCTLSRFEVNSYMYTTRGLHKNSHSESGICFLYKSIF